MGFGNLLKKGWRRFWHTDNMIFGIVVGTIFPILACAIVLCIDIAVMRAAKKSFFLPDDTIFVIAVAINILTFRHFMVRSKYDKTGRGILLVTFLYAFVYLLLFYVLDMKRVF